jgi:hypothetical protein
LGVKDFNSVVTPPKIAGIKANVPFYKLAWLINQSFNIKLAFNLDWTKSNNETEISKHQHYFCRFDDVELNWHLIQNKGDMSYFFQTKPMFDYLLICNGEDIYNYFERAMQSIKTNSKIDFIHPFDFQLVKSKEAFFNNFLKTKLFIEEYLHV